MDMRDWVVPLAFWHGETSLPCRQCLDETTGEECREVLEQYKDFHERAHRYFEQFLEMGTPEEVVVDQTIRVEGGFDFAVLALAQNYRICRDLVNRLGLLGDAQLFNIVAATVGLAVIADAEAQKKTGELTTTPTM